MGTKDHNDERIRRIVGLGCDTEDGHVRITRGENFDVYLGSEQTHERMQETCMKINRRLDERGRRLEDLSHDEFIELLSEIG